MVWQWSSRGGGAEMTQKIVSKDSTKIAFERMGQGPSFIMVNGALGYHEFYGGRDLSGELSKDFTVYIYDRRGRGESTDTQPYAVEREIEDIEALINVAGGSVYLYGISSGAALALRAAAKLGPTKVLKLALYEPPYNAADDDKAKHDFAEERKRMAELLKAGKRGDAVAFFLASMATPEMIEGMKQSQEWQVMETVAHTLAYDYTVLGDGSVPLDVAKAVTMQTLVMDGSKSEAFMHEAAESLGKAMLRSEGNPSEPNARSVA